MPRKPTGTLIWTKAGWAARIPVVVGYVDGKPVKEKRWFPLGTANKTLARRKLAKLVADAERGIVPTAETAARAEPFGDAAERVHEARVSDGVVGAKDEIARLKAYATAIWDAEVTKIPTTDLNTVLDDCKAAGKSRQTVTHLKQDLRNVFAALVREGAVDANPADGVTMPKFPEAVRKERAVLTDQELAVYLAWEHPEREWRNGVLERQTMACIARMFGGLRTGDLHTLCWEAFDLESGPDGTGAGFTWGWAPRRKTKRPQLLEVPKMLRPILRDWWERAGRPTSGLVFPARRGKRAGQSKTKVSHARAFRRDLRRAFGIDVAERRDMKRSNGRPLNLLKWNVARDLTPRERELFEETEFTLPVDFHSWRRAFSQALADADVNAQQASALAGHASLAAHSRYLLDSGRVRTLPERALPQLTIGQSSCPNDEFDFPKQRDFSGADGTRTRGLRRDRPAL